MSAERCNCHQNSCGQGRLNNRQHNRASENMYQNMWYNWWWNYQHGIYMNGQSGRNNMESNRCMTCVEEQRLREERVKTVTNRQTYTAANDKTNDLNTSNHLLSGYDLQEMNDTSDKITMFHKTKSDCEDDDEDDNEFEMELNNDFKKFLEQSARHKEQRKKEAELARAETADYIEVNEIPLEATTVAPTQQQGVLRTHEMKTLYGRSAHHIESLETSLQLHFNMNVDMRHPVFWPSIPLKF